MSREIRVLKGSVLQYRLYDVAWEIDLAAVQDKVMESKRLFLKKKLSSRAFEFANPPVSLALKGFERPLGGAQRNINAYAKIYDYGVLSVMLEIPVDGASMAEVEDLARLLRDEEPLEEAFRGERDRLVEFFRETMTAVNVSRFMEDYTVYNVRLTEPELAADDFLSSYPAERLLLYESGESRPGKLVVKELLQNRFSYSDHDLVLINWDNALVLEPTESLDIPDLLEFANAQLLELRVYDDILDRELDNIHERLSSRSAPSIWKIKGYEELAAKVMRTITELTEITEKVDNSLKVTDDVYYARVYTSALRLFRVKQWEESIRKKIDIASRVYDMIHRDIANKRTELLEFIIVVLIAVEIVLFFFLSF